MNRKTIPFTMGQLYGKTKYILNIPTLYDFFNTFVRMSTEMNFHVFFVSEQ